MLSCSGSATEGAGTTEGTGATESAAVETYVYAPEVAPSRKYFVTVDGARQTVYSTEEAHICTFGCDGEVTVSVTAMKAIESVALRPLGKAYTYELKDAQTIEFKARPYDRIIAEFNGSEDGQLFIFVNPLSEKPDKDAADVVYYESGKIYTESHRRVQNGQKVYIEGGAVVKTKFYFENASDAGISGYGILDTWGNSVEVSSIRIEKSKEIEVSGITVLGDGGRVIFNEESSDVVIDNVKAIGRVGGDQCDAIDIYGCHDYTVRRCFAYGNDDTYCIKSWKWNFKGEVYNISFEDCIARNFRGNSFEIGYETGLDIHDVSYRDIYSIHSSGGSTSPLRRGAVTIHNGAAGHIHDISYENVHIEDPLEFGIDMRILKSAFQLGNGEEWAPGVIDGIRMKDVRIYKKAPQGNTLAGYDGTHTISVEFENLRIEGKKITSSADGGFAVSFADASFK